MTRATFDPMLLRSVFTMDEASVRGSDRLSLSFQALTNARETGEFVCNLATWELRDQMNASSGNLPREVDEFEVAKLTPLPSTLVKPPRVAESPVHMECLWLKTVLLPADEPEQPV